MASLSPEEKVEFLIQLLVTGGEFSPNYAALAKVMGINTNSNAQRRLKSIVEADKRFVLKAAGSATRIVMVNDDGKDDDSIENVDKSNKATKKGRGRKRTKAENDNNADETQPRATKKSRAVKVHEAGGNTVGSNQEASLADEEEV